MEFLDGHITVEVFRPNRRIPGKIVFMLYSVLELIDSNSSFV